MKKITLAVLNAVCLLVTLFVNYRANSGAINGKTMKIVSDTYHNLFTPAGYAFAIWGVIYLLLVCFVIYSFVIIHKTKENHVIAQVGLWFIASCVFNSLWIVAWLNDYIGISVWIMILLLITLLRIIVNIKAQLTDAPFRIAALVWWPFCLYSGWISVALIANIAAYLTKIHWNGWQLSQVTWTIIMIIVAGLIDIYMTWKRNMRAYALVGAWALIAVAVANSADNYAIYTTAITTAVMIAVSGLLHGIKYFRGFGNQLGL